MKKALLIITPLLLLFTNCKKEPLNVLAEGWILADAAAPVVNRITVQVNHNGSSYVILNTFANFNMTTCGLDDSAAGNRISYMLSDAFTVSKGDTVIMSIDTGTVYTIPRPYCLSINGTNSGGAAYLFWIAK